ncbi:MAG: hypothetical protein GY804_06810 [Alphaproteobacteria bacterium]|nr:hypothetical protein [Alphaproteobacteria bacterium]
MTKWYKCRCPKCNKVHNYSKTISGEDKCSESRCTGRVKIEPMTEEEKAEYHKDQDERNKEMKTGKYK